MKIFNVGLVGNGKMGKIYVKEIKKNINFKIIDILDHKNLKKKPELIKKFFNSKIIDLFIISSPIKTHFKYLEYAYASKKNIIIEKPLVEKINQLRKLIQLNKNYNKKIMIHHNDVVNFKNLNFMKDFTNYKKIKMIEMFYGKKEIVNSYKKPFFDWLPHPLAIIINFFGVPNKFKILEYSKKIKKKSIFEKLKLVFELDYFKIFLNFSNDFKKSSKKIIIYTKNKKKIYDGYNKKNQRSVKLLLEKFNKVNKINDINSNINVYKLLFKIEEKISKIKKPRSTNN